MTQPIESIKLLAVQLMDGYMKINNDLQLLQQKQEKRKKKTTYTE